MSNTAPAQDEFSGDEYDDLFAYDIGELDISIPTLPTTTLAPQPKKRKEDELGLDDEVSVKKKRVTVKLDEERLVCFAGSVIVRLTSVKVDVRQWVTASKKRGSGEVEV